MNDQQIECFNKLFSNAADRQSKLVFTNGYKYSSIGYFGKRKLRKSITDFEECLSIVPDHWQSMVLKAKAHQRLGEHKEAFDLLEQAFQTEKENHTIPMEASLEAMHLKMIEKAIFYSEESLKRKPNDFVLLGNHAMNLLVAESDTKAKDTINKAIELNPNDKINRNIEKTINEVISGKRKRPTFKDAIG